MKRFLSSWQGLLAGIIALLIYILSPVVIRHFDPTAGTYDGGFLQWIALATAIYFWGIFVVWVGWQIAFPSMDKWSDNHLLNTFELCLSPRQKFFAVQVSFILMGVAWFVALKLVPVQ